MKEKKSRKDKSENIFIVPKGEILIETKGKFALDESRPMNQKSKFNDKD